MISAHDYFGAKPHSEDQEAAALDLLERVNKLLAAARAAGAYWDWIDPDTGSQISGSKGGAGDGGFRLPTATTGSPHSSHKEAKAVDVYDPIGKLDDWLSEYDGPDWGNGVLEQFALYREAPTATPGWCHLTTRAPGSGRRTFNP